MQTVFSASHFSRSGVARILLAGCVLMLAGGAGAQSTDSLDSPADAAEFSLFGSVENETANDSAVRNTRRGRSSSASAEPEFTLVGTSRIGDRYSAILKNRDGNEVVVTTETGRNTRIEGYGQYSVIDVGPGRVSVQLPASSSCIEDRNLGVSCNNASNIASLELTKGEPVPRAAVASRSVGDSAENEGEVIVSEDAPEQPTNPFAALRARALQNGDAPAAPSTRERRFTPRRIDPADVPPGMRVVSTPFGDRLVRE